MLGGTGRVDPAVPRLRQPGSHGRGVSSDRTHLYHDRHMIGRPPRWLPNLSPAGILRGLDGANLVGADLVEVAPVYDHAEITCIAASHVAFELLGLFARRR